MRKISLFPERTTCELGDLFGIFFEDINHAADGGLYAELIENRSFEFSPIDNAASRPLTAWKLIEEGDAEVSWAVTAEGPSAQNPHCLTVEVLSPGSRAGFMNLGYNSGIFAERGKKYEFTCRAKNNGDAPAEYVVSLTGVNGEVYARDRIVIEGGEWAKYSLELSPDTTDTAARLTLTSPAPSCVSFDFISLFPRDTFRGRKNGLRRDIAELLADLKPKFMRFPGGCLIHDGSLDAEDRDSMYRWKKTLGPVEDRPARRSNWAYNQTLGLGYFEYFLFCEDIGAKPVPILPAGYNPHSGQGAPMCRMQEWVDDALDLIEFANGGTDTRWGAVRAELGHPEPFGLEYIGIGNEEAGEGFFRRYPLFHKAIRKKYPDIKIINSAGPFAAGREFERGWSSAREHGSDIVDEHYYTSPEWLIANIRRYDSYDRRGPKAFLGEYASWGNTWYNALCEAAYMTGLEKNADAVALACYAPLLANVDYVNWQPDMIWFDNHRAYGSANYYVQKLFMNHQGTKGIEQELAGFGAAVRPAEETMSGGLEFVYGNCPAEFFDIELEDRETGEVTKFAPVSVSAQKTAAPLGDTASGDYTLRFKAKKLGGQRGFVLTFGKKDDKNRLDWSLGGWGGDSAEFVSQINGRSTSLTQERFSPENGVVYECELSVCGRKMTGEVKGYFREEAEDILPAYEELYTTASVDEESGDVILKAVNVRNTPVIAEVNVPGAVSARIYEMAGFAPEAENTFDAPRAVAPAERELEFSGAAELEFKPSSVSVIRFRREK